MSSIRAYNLFTSRMAECGTWEALFHKEWRNSRCFDGEILVKLRIGDRDYLATGEDRSCLAETTSGFPADAAGYSFTTILPKI